MLKRIYIPYSDTLVLYKTVLIEKYVDLNRPGLLTLCCYINDIPVYSTFDFLSKRQITITTTDIMPETKYVISGCSLESLQFDSFIIWQTSQAIYNYDSVTFGNNHYNIDEKLYML